MSKGTEAISILQRYFGERVDPSKALALMFGKLEQQNELLGMFKNLACAMAFDHGTLVGELEGVLGTDAFALLSLHLPRCELRAEVIEPTQSPSRIIT